MRSKQGNFISQLKYILKLLKETSLLGFKPVETTIRANHKLGKKNKEHADDQDTNQIMVKKFIYTSHQRPNIAYAVSVSQFIHT